MTPPRLSRSKPIAKRMTWPWSSPESVKLIQWSTILAMTLDLTSITWSGKIDKLMHSASYQHSSDSRRERTHEPYRKGIAEMSKVHSRMSSVFGDIFKAIPRYYANIFRENPTAADFYIFIFGSGTTIMNSRRGAHLKNSFHCSFWFSSPERSWEHRVCYTTKSWTLSDDFIGLIDFVSSNSIPSAWVWAIFAQFILIVVDRYHISFCFVFTRDLHSPTYLYRTLYLYRAIRLKLMLHYASIVFYHVLIFFILPSVNQQNFNELPELVWFYLFKLTYLLFSSLQVCISTRMHGRQFSRVLDWIRVPAARPRTTPCQQHEKPFCCCVGPILCIQSAPICVRLHISLCYASHLYVDMSSVFWSIGQSPQLPSLFSSGLKWKTSLPTCSWWSVGAYCSGNIRGCPSHGV